MAIKFIINYFSLMRGFLLLMALLLVTSCNEDSPSSNSSKTAEAAKIEKEVAIRVNSARLEAAARDNLLHTFRVVGFILLAGGAVAGLMWVQRPPPPEGQSPVVRFPETQPALMSEPRRTRSTRVIDFPTILKESFHSRKGAILHQLGHLQLFPLTFELRTCQEIPQGLFG